MKTCLEDLQVLASCRILFAHSNRKGPIARWRYREKQEISELLRFQGCMVRSIDHSIAIQRLNEFTGVFDVKFYRRWGRMNRCLETLGFRWSDLFALMQLYMRHSRDVKRCTSGKDRLRSDRVECSLNKNSFEFPDSMGQNSCFVRLGGSTSDEKGDAPRLMMCSTSTRRTSFILRI